MEKKCYALKRCNGYHTCRGNGIPANSVSMDKESHASKSAMKHPDVLGAGAAKRAKIHNPNTKVATVMAEYERGTLHSGGGQKVSNPKQAIAIALSEAGKSKRKDLLPTAQGSQSMSNYRQGRSQQTSPTQAKQGASFAGGQSFDRKPNHDRYGIRSKN